VSVFQSVVQDRGGNDLQVIRHARHDRGSFQGVQDVGRVRPFAQLSAVSTSRKYDSFL